MTTLNYKVFGEGPPIIILHGLFGTLDNWQTIAKKLAKNYTVFIVDQRNHGRSPHMDTHTYDDMSEDLLSFMESQWIYKAHIIGHSMGGKTAMNFALNNPSYVDKLIVVDISPKTYIGNHGTIFDTLLALDLEKVQNRKEADAIFQKTIPEFGVRQFLLKNLTRDKEKGYIWKMNLPILLEYYPQILAKGVPDEIFEDKTLFIRGKRSSYIQDDEWHLVTSHFPNAQLKTIADAGHWVHAEAPVEFYNVLEDFLAS